MTITFPGNYYYNIQYLTPSDELGYSLMGFFTCLLTIICALLYTGGFHQLITYFNRLLKTPHGKKKREEDWVPVYKY